MNFNKGHNAFSDIPGFDASKGERIVKALQKLWKKIEHLEQIRTSERKSRSEVSRSSNDEDLTITDVQYKLLVLQLQYARSILKKKLGKHNEVINAKINDSEQNSPVSGSNNLKDDELHNNFKSIPVPQESQKGNKSVEVLIPPQGSNIPKNATRKSDEALSSDHKSTTTEYPFQNTASVPQKPFPTSSKPHYHLKLDDVPFILGASSTASHSVVANVQNIIAMMKSHNKALCGPKHHATRFTVNSQPTHATETHQDGGDSQEATKMLNDLSRDLYELALKQQKLVKSIDAAQGKSEASSITKDFQREDTVHKVSDKHAENYGCRRLQSKSESEIKLHAEVKNLSKTREKDFIKSNVHQRQNLSNARSQTSNHSIMDRRKLLRSLQNFKTHLSEEDISWD